MSDLPPASADRQPVRAEAAFKILHGRFNDFEQVREATIGWDLDWRQLDAGRLSAMILQILSGATALTLARFSRKFDQRGSSPPGTRTFALLDSGVDGVRWCGQNVTDDHVLIFSSAGSYDSVSEPGFAVSTLSFQEERLAEVAETLGIPDSLTPLNPGGTAVRVAADMTEAIRRRVRRISDLATEGPTATLSERHRPEMEWEIPAALLSALASARQDSSSRPPARARTQGRKRAVAFIDDHAHEAVTVEEVCKASGVSWRTLDYAFREHFGVTPKQYLQAARLNAVRKELARVGSPVKIADVANRWGFWHMGQFAADYRKLFGELPSERSRSSRGHSVPGERKPKRVRR